VCRLDDEIGAAIADSRQTPDETGERDLVVLRKRRRKLHDVFAGRKAREQSARRDHDRPDLALSRETREKGELVAPGLERRGNALVGSQRRSRRVEDSRETGSFQVADQELGFFFIGDDDGERPADVLGERREQETRESSDPARNDETVLSLPEPLDELRVSRNAPRPIRKKTQRTRPATLTAKPLPAIPLRSAGHLHGGHRAEAFDGFFDGFDREVHFFGGVAPAEAEADRRMGEIV